MHAVTHKRLWPDRLIDAATGDTMAGLHDVGPGGGPCLMCLFPAPRHTRSSLGPLSALTGLPVQRLRHGDTPLQEEDLAELPPEQATRLQGHLGRPSAD
jgi:hypothetical protein